MSKFERFGDAKREIAAQLPEPTLSTSAMPDILLSTSSMPDFDIIEPPLRRERIVPEDDESSHELLGVLIMLAVAAAWAIVWL